VKRNRLDAIGSGAIREGVTEDPKSNDEARPARRRAAADEREQRLAAALRANLRRRKAGDAPRE